MPSMFAVVHICSQQHQASHLNRQLVTVPHHSTILEAFPACWGMYAGKASASPVLLPLPATLFPSHEINIFGIFSPDLDEHPFSFFFIISFNLLSNSF